MRPVLPILLLILAFIGYSRQLQAQKKYRSVTGSTYGLSFIKNNKIRIKPKPVSIEKDAEDREWEEKYRQKWADAVARLKELENTTAIYYKYNCSAEYPINEYKYFSIVDDNRNQIQPVSFYFGNFLYKGKSDYLLSLLADESNFSFQESKCFLPRMGFIFKNHVGQTQAVLDICLECDQLRIYFYNPSLVFVCDFSAVGVYNFHSLCQDINISCCF